jgi:hypothetical protein
VTRGGRRSNEKRGLVTTDGGQGGWRGMVRTGEAPVSLTHGPWPAVGGRGRGRGEVRVHEPAWKRKRRGPSLKE